MIHNKQRKVEGGRGRHVIKKLTLIKGKTAKKIYLIKLLEENFPPPLPQENKNIETS